MIFIKSFALRNTIPSCMIMKSGRLHYKSPQKEPTENVAILTKADNNMDISENETPIDHQDWKCKDSVANNQKVTTDMFRTYKDEWRL